MVSGWTLEYLILLPSILMAGVFGGWMSIIVGIIVAPKKSIFVLIVLGVSTAVFSADKILNGAIFESNIVNSQTIALFLGNILYLITSFGVLANTYLRPDEDLF